MIRVYIACEGPTEMTFVREALQPAFSQTLHLIQFLPGKLASRTGRGRGGDIRYARVWKDFTIALKSDGACYCTTLFDYYALGADFPRLDEPRGSEPDDKARRIESAVEQDIASKMGGRFNPGRFRCFLAMHEFEGLLFSAPSSLASGLGCADQSGKLQEIRDQFSSPEHINDNRKTAPSKRLKAICHHYKDKVTSGNVAALKVGLDAMRRECPHFRSWLEWLESLSPLQ